MVAKLKVEDEKIEGLGVLVDLLLGLRLIFAFLPSSQEWFFNFSLIFKACIKESKSVDR